jgi:hypothetical protein
LALAAILEPLGDQAKSVTPPGLQMAYDNVEMHLLAMGSQIFIVPSATDATQAPCGAQDNRAALDPISDIGCD